MTPTKGDGDIPLHVPAAAAPAMGVDLPEWRGALPARPRPAAPGEPEYRPELAPWDRHQTARRWEIRLLGLELELRRLRAETQAELAIWKDGATATLGAEAKVAEWRARAGTAMDPARRALLIRLNRIDEQIEVVARCGVAASALLVACSTDLTATETEAQRSA